MVLGTNVLFMRSFFGMMGPQRDTKLKNEKKNINKNPYFSFKSQLLSLFFIIFFICIFCLKFFIFFHLKPSIPPFFLSFFFLTFAFLLFLLYLVLDLYFFLSVGYDILNDSLIQFHHNHHLPFFNCTSHTLNKNAAFIGSFGSFYCRWRFCPQLFLSPSR